jgi:hypothetical protein
VPILPGFGPFNTESRHVELKLDGRRFMFEMGTLPSMMEMTLSMITAKGIIGSALFENAPVTISPSRGTVVIGPSFDLRVS